MNKEIILFLRNLDLNDLQIKIYLSLLKKGMSSVFQISEDININRSQIYKETKELVSKGFLEVGARKTKKYIAISPDRLIRIADEKIEKLKSQKSLVEELNKIKNMKAKKDTEYEIKIFEGMEEVKKVFKFEMEDSIGDEIISFTGNADYQFNFISEEFWYKQNEKFVKNGGRARIIVDYSNKSLKTYNDKYKNSNLLTRGLNDFPLEVNIDVWKDKTLIVHFGQQMFATIIENKVVAESYKILFEKLWNIAK